MISHRTFDASSEQNEVCLGVAHPYIILFPSFDKCFVWHYISRGFIIRQDIISRKFITSRIFKRRNLSFLCIFLTRPVALFDDIKCIV